jgi:hypothetical protein
MQEMLYPTSYLKSKGLGKACAPDHRRPLLRRHLRPLHRPRVARKRRKAALIGLVEDGDTIEIDIPNRTYFGKDMNAYNNPIEWCVPRFDKGDAVCIFWEGSDRARYIDTSGGTPLNASPTSPSGMVGPMPQVQEQAVDFGHQMKIQVIVDTFRSNRITVATRISEGDDWSSLGRTNVIFDEGDTVTLKRFDGEFKLTAHRAGNGEITDVDVEVIKEPKAGRLQTFKDVLEMFMALKAAEAAKAAEDTDESDTASSPEED